MTPEFQVIVDGKDISTKLSSRLIGLTMTDNRGFEADTLEITLDDTDGALALPRRGAKMKLALGWQGEGLVDKGFFTVDELEYSGPPDTLTIRGKSADMRGSLMKSREESYHKKTVKDIIGIISGRHKLKDVIAERLSSELIDHIDQANESDAGFLSRLADTFDAVATVKNDNLLFIKAGEALSASGKALAPVVITKNVGDSYRFSIADRNAYTGVVAFWQDTKGGKRKAAKATTKTKDDKKSDEVLVGDSENVKTLRHIYVSEKNALRSAKAMWEKLQRGMAALSITLAIGRADVYPECPVTVLGFKPEIDNADWILTKVTHQLDDSGFVTQLALEVKNNEIPDIETE